MPNPAIWGAIYGFQKIPAAFFVNKTQCCTRYSFAGRVLWRRGG